jgi:hypothetical protein
MLASPPLALASPARVAVTPTSRLGEFKVDVRGFFKDETLSTWLTGPSQQVFRTNDYQTTNRGRVDFRLFMLRHFQPGPWAITVVGQRSGHEVIARFENPDRGRNASVAMSETSLRLGDTVRVTGAGFGRNERVSYWYTLPDGSAARGGAEIESRSDGTVEFTVTVSRPDLEEGGWALSVYGFNSDNYGVATFEIR